MNKNLDLLLDDFELFCTSNIISGKARSYKLAIKYLCDFLDIKTFNDEALYRISYARNELSDINSDIYEKLLNYLLRNRRSSYLLKGWINAAFEHFSIFLKTHK